MSEPQVGDVIVRGAMGEGFMVVDAITRRILAGPLMLVDAIAYAKTRGSGRIWHESIDELGRPIGRPARLAVSLLTTSNDFHT